MDEILEGEILSDEGEEKEEDLDIDYLTKLNDVVTWSTDWTIESLINQIARDNIDLNPKFQRRDAWNNIKKSRLVESIIYGLPIPQIVLAEDKNKRGTFIIVDGKQRLLTLYQFCSSKVDKSEKLVLRGLNNPKLNGLSYEDLQNKHDELFNNFLNQSIRSVILKNWPSESFLYTIFYRLNTGSLSLSPQELRQALRPGKFIDFVNDFCQENPEIKRILKLERPDYRMRDIDLVIRFFSFKNRIEGYTGNYKTFLDDTCLMFNKEWAEREPLLIEQAAQLSEAIKFNYGIFEEDYVFRKWNWMNDNYDRSMNRAVFDIMCYYFSDAKVRSIFSTKKTEIKDQFNKLCKNNAKFYKSISSNTNNMSETSTRFVIWGESLNGIVENSVSIPVNLKDYLSKK